MDVLEAFQEVARYFCVVLFKGIPYGVRSIRMLTMLSPHLVESQVVGEPDQEHGERPTRLLTYHYTADVVRAITSQTTSLYDWVNPEMPDDPHLLRGDMTPVLSSIPTELATRIELSRGELDLLQASHPVVAKALRRESDPESLVLRLLEVDSSGHGGVPLRDGSTIFTVRVVAVATSSDHARIAAELMDPEVYGEGSMRLNLVPSEGDQFFKKLLQGDRVQVRVFRTDPESPMREAANRVQGFASIWLP